MKLEFLIHMAKDGAQFAASILTLLFCIHRLRQHANPKLGRKRETPRVGYKASVFTFEGKDEE